MGGIPTDFEGRVLADGKEAVLAGLYAAGECACVSVHGANRLGCNSLLDLLVFGRRSGEAMREEVSRSTWPDMSNDCAQGAKEVLETFLGRKGKEKGDVVRRSMQSLMAEYASVFRTEEGLRKGVDGIRDLKGRFAHSPVANKGRTFNYELMEAMELQRQLDLCEVILTSALHRRESRGAHFREDFPGRDDNSYLKHTLAFKGLDGPEVRYKPVRITRFQPEARVY
jgi:succinate dehydrogenase / fumarate reductase flavoprotein subunit